MNDAPPVPIKNNWRPPHVPLTIVVSLKHQEVSVYRGATQIAQSKVSTGKRGHDTRPGVFSILEKRRHHFSNLYDGAPMPWMQRMTWSGTALHGGVVPGYPASHGCVRLTSSFAPELFYQTKVGEHVIVASGKVVPEVIEHPNLFQPPAASENMGANHGFESGRSSTFEGMERGISCAALAVSGDNLSSCYNEGVRRTVGAPLRILVTRRTQRDQIRSIQYVLSSLGYLAPQDFDGTFGKATIAAIEAFEVANNLPKTGQFTDALVEKVHSIAGTKEPPEGHLFVRQDFRALFDMPISFARPDLDLGTHVFTAVQFSPKESEAQWVSMSLEGGDAKAVLDRIEIPLSVREKISKRLTPGSSLIVGEDSDHSAILPEGHDFIVWTKDQPKLVARTPSPQTKKLTSKKTARPRYSQTAKPKYRRKQYASPARSGFRGLFGGR